MLMQAVRGELTVGTIRYSIFEGRPHISMIEVLEDYRRQGIATQMLRYLQGQYPNEEIVWGYNNGYMPICAVLFALFHFCLREI